MKQFVKWMMNGAAGLALAGCTVGPDYKKPSAEALNLPGSYAGAKIQPATQPTADEAAQDKILTRWWDQFNDPKLASLVMRAMAGNLDVKVAESRVRQARAALGISEADWYPSVDVNGTVQRARNGNIGQGGGNRTGNIYRAGLDASWEIDIFGGTRRAVEAAGADLDSTVENKRDVLITLAGDVAVNYITYRGLQRQLTVAYNNLKSQNESVDLTSRKFAAGLTSELDVARAKAQVATTASAIPVLETSLRQTLHNLGVLLGQPPATLQEELADVREIPVAPMDLPTGIPADLLRRRPDIRRAERNLAAATARIGESTADLYPRFSLTGSFGYEGIKSNSTFNDDGRFWSIGPAVNWPLFDANRIRNTIRLRTAQQEEAMFIYESTVITSMREVEDALVALAKQQARRASLWSAVEANRRSVDLATQLYTKGLGDFLSVITAEQALFLAEDDLARSDTTVSNNLVSLYKALGGGWEVPEEPRKQ